jgi:hypothetical protein
MFFFFNQKWGPFSIDRFADSNNHQLDNFYSLFWTLGSKGVDAFADKDCKMMKIAFISRHVELLFTSSFFHIECTTVCLPFSSTKPAPANELASGKTMRSGLL